MTVRKIKAHEVANDHFYKLYKGLYNFEIYPKEKLSVSAKTVYAYLRDKHSLSVKNNRVDKEGNVYVDCTRSTISEDLGMSLRTVQNCMKELNECELIEEVRRGINKPNMIYVGHIKTTTE